MPTPRQLTRRRREEAQNQTEHQPRTILVLLSSLPCAAALQLSSRRAQQQLPLQELALASLGLTASGVARPPNQRRTTTAYYPDAGKAFLLMERGDVLSSTRR